MTTTKSQSFPELLRTYRYEAGFSQADLAQALDNHQPVISNYERGRLTPQGTRYWRLQRC